MNTLDVMSNDMTDEMSDVMSDVIGWSKKNLTDQILYSLYLKFWWSDLQNVGVYPP
jgi:hypothetical protein